MPAPQLIQPETSPLKTLAESRSVTFGEMTATQREMLEAALAKAHIGLCGYMLHISVGAGEPDLALEGDDLRLHQRAFETAARLQLHLRHAMEWAIWKQACPQPITDAQWTATQILADLTTRRFFLQMLPAEKQDAASALADFVSVKAESDEAALAQLAATYRADAETLALVTAYAAVTRPTEFTLTLQGDERLLIDPATGLNKYGCSPRPRPEAITFSSCTASSVSEYAFCAAEQLRQRFMATLATGGMVELYESEMERVRAEVARLLEFDPQQTHVILSTSGTDAELYPLLLFKSGAGSRMVNIIVAPDEVGSGTVLAAGGSHFCSATPRGSAVKQGDAVEGLDSVEVVCIPIRGADSAHLSIDEVHRSVEHAVADAATRADVILLHVVDNTKTGVVVPEVAFVCGLQARFGDKLRVVVDACQFRLERVNLHRYLAHGFSVLITGSKFFTGPPFSGAFLIPPSFGITGEGAQFPPGFAEYFTRSEMPERLRARAKNLPQTLNLGLLFRWTGALQEMRSFYSVPPEQRTAILESFRNELVASINANADLHLLEPAIPARWHDADRSLWDALPTIFSFAVRNPATGAWLSIKALRSIYLALNRDWSADLPAGATDAERSLAAQRCHIGQPVVTARTAGGETGALRIACGARLVYGITYDSTLGSEPAERFARELADARTVLAKVSLIVRHLPL